MSNSMDTEQESDKKVMLSYEDNEERINTLENRITAINVIVSTIKEDISEIKNSQKDNQDKIEEVKEINITQKENEKYINENIQSLKESVDKLTENANNSLSKRFGDTMIKVALIGGVIVAVYLLFKDHINLF
jgi:chromosome segregation ATPase